MIEVRNSEHVALLFVDKAFQQRGIAKELLHRALNICRNNDPALSQCKRITSDFRTGTRQPDGRIV
jgi:GNAT superfamily N-acetyltransferase